MPRFFVGILSSRRKIISWKKLRGFKQSPGAFAKRLSISGINFWGLIAALTDNPSNSSDKSQTWLESVKKEFNRTPGTNSHDLPILIEFLERGIINPFEIQIQIAMEELSKRLTSNNLLPKSDILNVALSAFLPQLERIVRRAVILEINVLRMKGVLEGTNPSERFMHFKLKCKSADYRSTFYKKYPVLLRIVIERLHFWVNFTDELLTRLDQDSDELRATFKGINSISVAAINLGGDTHNEGRSVAIVQFTDDRKLVYKPRDVSLEYQFQSFITSINKFVGDVNLKTISVIVKDDYGWVEFVEHSPIKDDEDKKVFFSKLGALTSITFFLDGVDFFFENVVACGSDPVLVDLETLFHGNLDSKSDETIREWTQKRLLSSVLGIGILPQPQQGSSETDVFDISVIGAREGLQAPYNVSGLDNFGRDDIRITAISGWIPSVHSSPSDDLVSKEILEHFLAGFKKVATHFLNNKKYLLSKTGPIASFQDCTRRLILRDTIVYGRLQDDETHPDLLRDQTDRQWHWDNLWADLIKRPMLDNFIASELQQTFIGDIPYFSGRVNENKVTGGDKSQISLSNILPETSYEKVRRKIRDFDVALLAEQERYICASLGLNRNFKLPDILNQHKKNNCLVMAELVGQEITSRLLYKKNNAWLGEPLSPISSSGGETFNKVQAASLGLYDGIAGVALFLFYLADSTGQQKYIDHSRSLMKSLFEEILAGSIDDISAYTGSVSLIYTLNKMSGLFLSCSSYQASMKKLLAGVSQHLKDDSNLDVLGGVAGVCLGLISSKNNLSSTIINKNLLLASKILESRSDSLTNFHEMPKGLSYKKGFAHGLAGIAFTMYKLSQELNKPKLMQQALKLTIYESEIVTDSGWTDSHMYDGKALAGWCHGAPGIALASSQMPLLQNDIRVKRYYEKAIQETLNSGIYSSHCLCHGTMGNISIMRSISEEIHSEKYLEDFANLGLSLLCHQGFQSFGSAQTQGSALMTGLSGLGFSLLQLADQKKIPNLLLLE